jgi:hypothetical protein
MKAHRPLMLAAVLMSLPGLVLASTGVDRRRPPISKLRQVAPLTQVAQLELEPIDRTALLAEDEARAKPAPLRVGVVEAVSLSPETAGSWEDLGIGGRLWRLRVASPAATELSFGFSRFRLPPGASLHIVSESEEGFFQGPYTAADNAAHGELWTAMVPGERAFVELFVPAAAEFAPELQLAAVSRGYRQLLAPPKFRGDQGSCNIDVICPDGDEWRDEIRAIARYTFVDGALTYLCTGNLVRDVPGTLTPYFLTAAHCGVTDSNDQSVVVYWNFESAACGDLDGFPGSWADNQSGAVFRAARGGPPSYGDNDMRLLELEETPDASFNVYYAGWDARTAITPQGGVCIHHPSGEAKAIAFNDDALTITSSCIGSSSSNTHWEVDNYEEGTTEQGSSGAGLWDPDTHRIVGYLSGGSASCANPAGYDCFGRFAIGWNGASASARLKDWLDPGNTGTLFVDGIDTGGGGSGQNVASCGNAAYDDGVPEGTAWFGAGNAGDPRYMYAVWFKLSDFGYSPGNAKLTRFCASNQNTWTGGPWPNQVFVYPDNAGFPDDSTVLAQGTVYTGDGQGWYEITLDSPVSLDGDFWLVMRGDPRWAGEDFNMDFDSTSASGQSLVSEAGVAGLTLAPRNFMLRATLATGGGNGYGDGPYNYHLGAIVRSTGVGGAFFRTKLGALNLGTSSATVTLTYFWNNGPTTVARTLAGSRLETWDDVAQTLFGLGQNTSGSVLINSTQPLIITSRTYTTDDKGTFGSFMPGVEVADGVGVGQTGILSQLVGTNAFRTNVGVVNLTASACQARVRVKSKAGADLGTPRTLTLDPYKFTQINDVFAATGAGSQADAYATVEALTAGCRVWAYASVIDGTNASPGTNDPTLIPVTVVD